MQFYTAWNLHEPIPGKFDFETGMNNLAQFLTAIKEADMFAMFRPGPYICAEYEMGGFPAWLLRDPNIRVRSNYKPYLDAVERYFTQLLSVVKKFQFTTNGGPIIGMQIENEYANWGNTNNANDAAYLRSLVDMAKKYGMNSTLFYTSDNLKFTGTIPGGNYKVYIRYIYKCKVNRDN